jgi:outer membrane protein OmpA-like peptidoglycan-associated protein
MRLARTALGGVLLGSIAMVGVAAVHAEDMTKEQMIQSLQGGKTRSFQAPSASGPSQSGLADQLKTITKTRQITVEQRNKIADTVKEDALPTIDVEVFFAYDSAALEPETLPKLNTLGQALSDPRIKGTSFLIAGHTDAKGSAGYNLALSGHRADAVKEFLVHSFHLDPDSLVTIGFGEEQLKNPQDPFADENRRVQIVNVQAAPVAQQ